MHEVKISDKAYQEAKRLAAESGFPSVDAYVSDVLEQSPGEEVENLDDRFTPEVNAYLKGISESMVAGRSISSIDLRAHLEEVRRTWLESRAG